MKKESFVRVTTFAGLAVIITVVPVCSFSKEAKEKAIRENDSRCQRCGKVYLADQLYSHHLLPERFGGSTTEDNHYLVCSRCHKIVDDEAVFKGRLANGSKVTEVASDYPEIVSEWDKYGKAARRFGRKK